MDTETFTIGDLAQELGVTTRTIRFYEERGLIRPARSTGRQRVFSRRDRGHLKLILKHREAGFTLDEMKELLALYDEAPGRAGAQRQLRRFREILTRRLDDVEAKLGTLTVLRDRLRERIAYADGQLNRKRQKGKSAFDRRT
jgi:DNA-binding transcriptional MerR regulator